VQNADGEDAAARSDLDLHGDLTRRITELRRERQGYWQRILGAISK
jgi:hypothetical protein